MATHRNAPLVTLSEGEYLTSGGSRLRKSAVTAELNAQLQFQSGALHACVHEMRGLLVAGNYAQLLVQDRLGATTPSQKEYLELIIQNTTKIREVLGSLSWIAERDGWSIQLVSVGSLLAELAELSEMSSLCSGFAAKRAPCIWADRDKLRDALLILVALFGPSVPSCSVSEPSDAQVRLTLTGDYVTMAGCLHGETKMPGLSTSNPRTSLEDVRHVVRLHGGSLFIEAPDSAACEVTITFPKANVRGGVACA